MGGFLTILPPFPSAPSSLPRSQLLASLELEEEKKERSGYSHHLLW